MDNSFAYMRLNEKNFLQCKSKSVQFKSLPIHFVYPSLHSSHVCDNELEDDGQWVSSWKTRIPAQRWKKHENTEQPEI